MHSKVISKIRCYSPNKKGTSIRNKNYLYYIASREGVDLAPLADKIPSKANESANDLTYLQYIHERPRSSGLFGNIDTSDLNSVCRNIDKLSKNQCIYRGILSLSGEDAKGLGFTTKKAWRNYLALTLPEISETLGIPASELEWVAAFHKEETHPHVHYMLWSNNANHVQTPFISIPQQHRCREAFSGRFFAAERSQLTLQKNTARSNLISVGKTDTQTEMQRLVDEICQQPSYRALHRINLDFLSESAMELLKLTDSLPQKGSIKYAYLPPEVKKQADKVVECLLKKSELKSEYDSYLNYHKQIAETYSPTKKELQVAILKGKEDIDKRLANIALKAAQELRKNKDFYYALLNTHLPSYGALLRTPLSQDTISGLQNDASENENPQANYLLGRIHDDPESGYYDPSKAMEYYKKAAAQGDDASQGILGSKYTFGKDVEKDEVTGLELLHNAQDKGNTYAKDAESAYNSYHQECANYQMVMLMASLLDYLCYTNHTRRPSSVYRAGIDKNNKKALREKVNVKSSAPH